MTTNPNTSALNPNTTGILFMVAAMAGFAIEDMFMKIMGDVMSPMQVLFILGIFGGLSYALIAAYQGINVFDRKLLDKNAIMRMVFEVAGTLGFACSIILGSVSIASAVVQALPLIVTLGAALFLGEKVGWRRWSAIFIGLFGVLLVIEPWQESFNATSLLALFGAFGLGARDIVTRRVRKDIPSISLAAWGFWSLVPGSLILMFFGQKFTSIPSSAVMPSIFALVAGLAGYYVLILSMRIGDVAVIAPFRYTRLIFGGAIGALIFGEQLSNTAIIGALIILASGLYTFMRERKVKGDIK